MDTLVFSYRKDQNLEEVKAKILAQLKAGGHNYKYVSHSNRKLTFKKVD